MWTAASGAPNSAKFMGGCIFDKGGITENFEFLCYKNVNFLEVLRKAIKKGLLLRILRKKSPLFKIYTQIFLKIRGGGSTPLPKSRGVATSPHFGAPVQHSCIIIYKCVSK